MIARKKASYLLPDDTIDTEAWLASLKSHRSPEQIQTIQNMLKLAIRMGESTRTPTQENCLQQGLAMADLLDHLHLDAETLSCALIYPTVNYGEWSVQDKSALLSPSIQKLLHGVAEMNAMSLLHSTGISVSQQQATQIDNLRRMLLAMVRDIRVVLIKLAERLIWMRRLKYVSPKEQVEISQETHDIYAPLANRLGIGQIKWELEDLSFRYLNPEIYKAIAKGLDQKRTEREQSIHRIIENLKQALTSAGLVHFSIQGRAKHIFSIYKKMARKGVDISQIYDISAVRVLVETVADCYTVLGFVHAQWQPIASEFDDYIVNPKPNGYRSLHTAVIDEFGQCFEVQIRTHEMHQESELGVAAHWVYKEGGGSRSSYDQKIAWLRELMDWQKEVRHENQPTEETPQIFEDRVYVFTPNNEIFDLSTGSTPLDFAYQVHTDIGHRCRGAKVNDHIVPLTYVLKTGDRIEILTAKQAHPSRDWANPSLGYLKSTRARNRVLQWYKKQDIEKHIALGKEIFDRECKRLNVHHFGTDALQKLALEKNRKNIDDFFAALGSGDIRSGQIVHDLESYKTKDKNIAANALPFQPLSQIKTSAKKKISPRGVYVPGIEDVLTYLAKCCRPIPGDQIIGYVSQHRGVGIHRTHCHNIQGNPAQANHRFVDVEWGEQESIYPVDIYIRAADRQGLLRDITTLFANEKVNMIAIRTQTDRQHHYANISITAEVNDLPALNHLLERVQQLSGVVIAGRKG